MDELQGRYLGLFCNGYKLTDTHKSTQRSTHRNAHIETHAQKHAHNTRTQKRTHAWYNTHIAIAQKHTHGNTHVERHTWNRIQKYMHIGTHVQKQRNTCTRVQKHTALNMQTTDRYNESQKDAYIPVESIITCLMKCEGSLFVSFVSIKGVYTHT